MGKHENPANCGMCGGNGKVVVNNDSEDEEINCPVCDGSGKA
jgi:DnaJ-class molecular chaperone